MHKGTRDALKFFGPLVLVGVMAFVIWAVQTEDKIVRYENDDTRALDAALRRGWHVKYTQVDKQKLYEVEIPITTVTLSRSNWSKMWND